MKVEITSKYLLHTTANDGRYSKTIPTDLF
jgi:hypothetical protein